MNAPAMWNNVGEAILRVLVHTCIIVAGILAYFVLVNDPDMPLSGSERQSVAMYCGVFLLLAVALEVLAKWLYGPPGVSETIPVDAECPRMQCTHPTGGLFPAGHTELGAARLKKLLTVGAIGLLTARAIRNRRK